MFAKIYHTKTPFAVLAVIVILLSNCKMQSNYKSPTLTKQKSWSSNNLLPKDNTVPSRKKWWLELHDEAINNLIAQTLNNNPTLDQALSRVDEARAILGVNKADYYPSFTAIANTTKNHTTLDSKTNSSSTTKGQIIGNSTTSIVKPALAWEIDLFGRIRSSVDAAQKHLDARSADAEYTKLILAAQVAKTVIDLRACNYISAIYLKDVNSRQKTFALIQQKTIAGFSSPVDQASSLRDLEAAKIILAEQNEICEQNINALIYLSGSNKEKITKLLGKKNAYKNKLYRYNYKSEDFIPELKETYLRLPASILTMHPSVVAANLDAEAAWNNIGVAKAERLPKIDLSAAFTKEWLGIAGSTIRSTSWAFGPNFAATLFDAGKGSSNVKAAKAQYQEAAAKLQDTIRATIKEIENALSAQKSADERLISAKKSLIAAKIAFNAATQEWKKGSFSLLELEDANRQYNIAENNFINAKRDRAKAWVEIINATANSIKLNQTYIYEKPSIPKI